MKVSIEIELKPFTVPNFVLAAQKPDPRGNGIKGQSAFALEDIDQITLYRMCEEFRKNVFAKAGKEMPPEIGATK